MSLPLGEEGLDLARKSALPWLYFVDHDSKKWDSSRKYRQEDWESIRYAWGKLNASVA